MDVAMVLRPDAFSRPGGDTEQAEQTARALERIGVHAWISDGGDLGAADVVHAFNLHTPEWTWLQVQEARRLGKAVVLSTVYWRSLAMYAGSVPLLPHLAPYLLGAISAQSGTAPPERRTISIFAALRLRAFRKILRQCHIIAPNSIAEAEFLKSDFPELRSRPDAVHVVVNGVDVDTYDRARSAPPQPIPELPARFAFCAARVDFRKNILRLIQARQRLGLPLVLTGFASGTTPFHDAYFEACHQYGGQVRFVGRVSREVLWMLYSRCAVHVLPSFYETPGLSSLEAALAGAPVVTTPYGSPKEYFGDLVEYCEPTSVRSIAAAISRALQGPPRPELAARVRERYTWDHAAHATKEAYESALRIA